MDSKDQTYKTIEKESLNLYQLIDIFFRRKILFISTIMVFVILSIFFNPQDKSKGYSTVLNIRSISSGLYEFDIMNNEIEKLIKRTAMDSMTYWKLIGINPPMELIGIDIGYGLNLVTGDTNPNSSKNKILITSDRLLISFFDYLTFYELIVRDFEKENYEYANHSFTLEDVKDYFKSSKIDFVSDKNEYPGELKKSLVKLTIHSNRLDHNEIVILSKMIFKQINKLMIKDLLQQYEQLVDSVNTNVDIELQELQLHYDAIEEFNRKNIANNKKNSEFYAGTNVDVFFNALNAASKIVELCDNAESEFDQIEACRYILDMTGALETQERAPAINKLKRKSNIKQFKLALSNFQNDINSMQLLVNPDFQNLEQVSEGRQIPFQLLIILFGFLFSSFMVYFVDGYLNYKKNKV